MRMFPAAVAPLLTALAAPAAPAQQPLVALAIPETADTPWPGGTMTLDVEASDVARGVFRVNQTVPLAPDHKIRAVPDNISEARQEARQ